MAKEGFEGEVDTYVNRGILDKYRLDLEKRVAKHPLRLMRPADLTWIENFKDDVYGNQEVANRHVPSKPTHEQFGLYLLTVYEALDKREEGDHLVTIMQNALDRVAKRNRLNGRS